MTVKATAFLNPGPKDQLGFGFMLSLGLHLLLILVVVLWPKFLPSRHQVFSPVYRVNLVGPPRMSSAPPAAAKPAAKPASKPAAKPASKPAAKPAVKPRVKPRPQPQPKKEAIGNKKTVKAKRIERKKPDTTRHNARILDSRLKRLGAKVKERERLESALDKLKRRVDTRDASQAAGAYGAGGGASSGQLSMRFQVYYSEIWSRIQRHWVLPEALIKQTQGLTAKVVIRIQRDGSLAKVWLEQSSGVKRYDQTCLRAAERAAPFPPLPAGMRGSSHEVGVNFRAEDMNGRPGA